MSEVTHAERSLASSLSFFLFLGFWTDTASVQVYKCGRVGGKRLSCLSLTKLALIR